MLGGREVGESISRFQNLNTGKDEEQHCTILPETQISSNKTFDNLMPMQTTMRASSDHRCWGKGIPSRAF